jgi:hypothetical protein
MIYAQIKSGRKLHLACQAGEEWNGEIVRAGSLSRPICGQHMEGNYRMTINVPLGNACKKCRAAYDRTAQ